MIRYLLLRFYIMSAKLYNIKASVFLLFCAFTLAACQTNTVTDPEQDTQDVKGASDSTQEQVEQPNNNSNNNEMIQKQNNTTKSYTTAPSITIDQSKTYIATLKTTQGDIKIQLDAVNAPTTVNSFVFLAKDDFYDGVIFHRVIAGFMAQGGDPTGTGMGDAGYKFNDEIHKENKNNKGTIAMANSGPNTNGSQFFINVADNNYLDGRHTVFGKVTEGMDIVDKIVNVETDYQDKPNEDVVITDVMIEIK